MQLVDSKSDIETAIQLLSLRGEEFCFSRRFSKTLLNRFCSRGFLPMAVTLSDTELFALKLHEWRTLLPPSSCRVKKSALKKFASHHLTVDTAFEKCVEAINAYHRDSWLSPPLVQLFSKCRDPIKNKVSLHSIELWNGSVLTAGELGYTVGSGYTSLTGFHIESSSGTAQLYALGKVLAQSGFRLWDLGMYAPYKISIGAQVFSRDAFLQIQKSVRRTPASFASGPWYISDLLETD